MILHFFISWIFTAIALLFTAKLISGVHVSGFGAALLGALAIAIVNMLIKPILVFFSLPLTILTFGLFMFVVTGVSFWIAAKLAPGFEVDGLWASILGAVVLSILNWAIGLLVYRIW